MKKSLNNSLSLRKVLLSAMVAAPLATLPVPLWALPSTGSGNLTSSAGSSTTITTVGSTLSINTPDKTVLKWVNFGSGTDTIGASDAIIYNLPSSSASVLNMVTGASATTIDGTLSSNGRILILNQNGITLSATGNVSAAGLSLSTRPETEFYYAANGDLGYTGTPTADITVNGNVTVGSSGTVVIAGKNVNIGTAPTGAEKIDGGTITVTAANSGAVTIGGAQAVTFGNVSAKYGTLSVNTNGGTLNIAPGVGDVSTGANATLTSGSGAVTQAGAGNVIIGTAGTLTVTQSTSSASGVSLTHLSTTGDGKALTVNLTSGTAASTVTVDKTGANASNDLVLTATTGGDLTAKATAGSVTLNASNIGGALTVNATGDIKSGGNVTVKSGSNISLTGTNIAYAGVGTLDHLATIAPAATGNVTISSDGDIALPGIAASKNITVTSGGSITEATTLVSSGTATFNAGGSVTLSGANDFATLVIKNAPSGTTVTDANGLTLGKGTAATGDVAVTATTGTIAFGAASGDTLSFGGKLDLTTTNANVTQASDNTSVTGTLTITAGTGSVTLAGSTGKATGLNNTYGKINVVSAANISLFAKNTLNLGDIAATGTLTAYSATAISNSGKVDIGGLTMLGAGTASAPGAIALDYVNSSGVANNLQSAVTVIDDINLLSGTASAIVSPIGNPLASSVTIVNSHDLTFSLPTNLYATTANIPVSLKVTGANNILSGALNTSGSVALTSDTGAITETNAANAFGTVSVTSNTGAVTVSSASALTVNATLNGTSGTPHPTSAVSFTSSGGNITLGSIVSQYNTGGTSFTGNSVVDSVPGIWIYGPVSFTANNGNINVSQSGHNFGGITANSSAHNGNVVIAEGGTMKIDTVSAGNGTISLSSANGDIITNTLAGTGIAQAAAGGAVSLGAANGKITLTRATNAFVGAVGITAKGNTTIVNGGALALGTVTISNGTLSLSAAGNVTQSGAANVFGDTTVTQTAAGKNITLTNTGNQFGGLILSTAGGGNISITEAGTLNLKSVQTSGKFTATSVTGDIVDTTDSTVANNGISNGAAAIGSASFTANNGNITLDNAANWFSTVSFSTNGNASLVQPTGAAADVTLGTSTVGGALTLTNQGAGFDILEASNNTLTITGNATFNTNAGAVVLDQSTNQFGPVRFVIGQNSTLTENTTFNLNAGTVATAPVIINTNGNFVTSGTGGSSFTNDLTINAIGTIIPSAGSLLVTGTLTVFSNQTKDLSALSKSGNLAGRDPVNLGTGAYTPPSP